MKVVHASIQVCMSLILDGIAELEANCGKCCAKESKNVVSKVCHLSLYARLSGLFHNISDVLIFFYDYFYY